MYGGMDRNAIPELKQGDAEFIAGVTKEFGTREKAAMRFVDQGFSFLSRRDAETAMKRFNQAWLLNQNYPEVYWGFAAILTSRGELCKAANMMDIAFKKGDIQPSAKADGASLFASCIASNSDLDKQIRSHYINQIDRLFSEANRSQLVSKQYVYFKWIHAKEDLGLYKEALEKIDEYERITNDKESIPPDVKENLHSKINGETDDEF